MMGFPFIFPKGYHRQVKKSEILNNIESLERKYSPERVIYIDRNGKYIMLDPMVWNIEKTNRLLKSIEDHLDSLGL